MPASSTPTGCALRCLLRPAHLWRIERVYQAAPRTKDYGALTLIVQRRWRVKYLRTVPASVFIPKPKVDSAVIRLCR